MKKQLHLAEVIDLPRTPEERAKVQRRVHQKTYRAKHLEECRARDRAYAAARRARLPEESRAACRAQHRKHAAKRSASGRVYREGNIARTLFNGARARARKAGTVFRLVVEDIIVPEFCPYLGLRLQMGHGLLCDASPSLDRIDSRLGYVPGNVEVISHRANRIKNDATLEDLESIVARMRRMRSS